MKKLFVILSIICSTVQAQTDSLNARCESDNAIGIVASAGGSLIRNQWSPVITGDIRFIKFNAFKIRTGIQCNYFSEKNIDGEYQNMFTNFIKAEFWQYQKESDVWLGGGVGYL